MHLYLRLIPGETTRGTFAREPEEKRLRECLAGAPGLRGVREVRPHPRGGYAVHLEHDAADEHPEALLVHLGNAGWLPLL